MARCVIKSFARCPRRSRSATTRCCSSSIRPDLAKRLAGKKVVVCDYPDGRLEVTHDGITLPYRTFDKLRSVHRTAVVENKRLDAALLMVAEMQEGRELKRSQRAPRRTGQTDHMFGIPDGSVGNGYVKRGRKPGRRRDFMNDPAIIARREKALARMATATAAGAEVRTPINLDAGSGRGSGRLDDVLAFLTENSGKQPEASLP